jgi:hypothetical protein
MGGGKIETPVRVAAQPGLEYRHANAAGILSLAPFAVHRQIIRLRLAFGLTPEQAVILAALVFGEGR